MQIGSLQEKKRTNLQGFVFNMTLNKLEDAFSKIFGTKLKKKTDEIPINIHCSGLTARK